MSCLPVIVCPSVCLSALKTPVLRVYAVLLVLNTSKLCKHWKSSIWQVSETTVQDADSQQKVVTESTITMKQFTAHTLTNLQLMTKVEVSTDLTMAARTV